MTTSSELGSFQGPAPSRSQPRGGQQPVNSQAPPSEGQQPAPGVPVQLPSPQETKSSPGEAAGREHDHPQTPRDFTSPSLGVLICQTGR